MNGKISQDTINEIIESANDNIDVVLTELGIDIEKTYGFNSEIRLCCPIHDGDNPTSFCYDTNKKTWACYTNNCHDSNYKIFGLAEKMLSKREGRPVGFRYAAEWLANILNINIVNYEEKTPEELELNKILHQIKTEVRAKNIGKIKITKGSTFKPFPVSLIKDKISASKYFLNLGFNKETLNHFMVGYCDDPKKAMYLRSFAPVLNDLGDTVIGVTGRIIYEECNFCGRYHKQGNGCPTENRSVRDYPKWMHYGFQSGNVLYNSWNLKEINKNKTIVLTEGPKDVWWMYQHGIENCCCIFGLNIFDFHIKKMLSIGIVKIISALNNDERGIDAQQNLLNKLGPYFKIENAVEAMGDKKDISLISSNDMYQHFVPKIKKLGVK